MDIAKYLLSEEEIAKLLSDSGRIVATAYVGPPELMIARAQVEHLISLGWQSPEEVAKLKAEIEALHRERTGEVWYWQGDSEDHLESLTCPVIIEADNLKVLISESKRQAILDYDAACRAEMDSGNE